MTTEQLSQWAGEQAPFGVEDHPLYQIAAKLRELEEIKRENYWSLIEDLRERGLRTHDSMQVVEIEAWLSSRAVHKPAQTLRAENERLREQRDTSIDHWKEVADANVAENEKLRHDIEKQNGDLDEMQSERDKLRAEKTELATENERLCERVARWEVKLERYRAALEKIRDGDLWLSEVRGVARDALGGE